MEFPGNLLYTKDHEWTQLGTPGSEDIVTVGITDHAQEALGEIVYAELPAVGRQLKEHETFGVVESIKAVSDLFSPVAGTVVEINSAVSSDPGLINREPYTGGWLLKMKLTDKKALEFLMKTDAYKALVESLK